MAPPRDSALRADPGVVVRTPLLPFETITAWTAAGDDVAAARRYLAALLDRPDVREAIFVASPSLHEALARWRRDAESAAGQRAERALVRYVARAAGRATPFGLFSGVSAGALGGETSLVLAPRAEYRRRTRLDNDYLFALADAIGKDEAARERLRYRPNSSLYRVGGRLRYAEARLAGKDRSYHLVSIEPTPYLDATLARAAAGARLGELAAALVADDPDVTLEEARGYLGELVDAQILVPRLDVAVTGPEPLDAFLAQLAEAGLDEPRRILSEVRTMLAALDGGGLGNDPARYQAIADALAPLPAKVELSRLFQVDMVKPAAATLAPRVVAEAARAIEWLRQVTRAPEQTSLDELRTRFRDRYEGREVPLAEALDEETGIGFEADSGPGSEGSPLLAGLRFPGRARVERVPVGRFEAHLQARLAEALAAGAEELELGDADLAAMKVDAPPALPDALSAMIRLAGDGDDWQLLLEHAGGPSGARVLGRFCHASPEIDAMVRAHLRAEEAQRPDAVFAEIVHLNEGRIGNILCRPVLRDHEIAFLGTSGAPPERQIALDDLMVSIRGERIVLTSRRLGREVIPRLSTAHNFRLRSLGVYRFLCALQNQGGAPGVGFSWGALARLPYLPRVRIGRVVVERAQWRLGKAELAGLSAGGVAALRARRRLPRFVVIAEGDNELPVDLDNPLMVAMFADEVGGRAEAVLKELFPAPDRLPVRGPEGTFTDELVVTFIRARAPVAAPAPPPPAPTVRRSFPPGSSWLYAKLYCGTATADRVLREAIAPLVRDVLGRGDASHWFFLRYADPAPHLRLRFAGEPRRLAAEVLPALDAALAPLRDDGAVWRVQLDTYERELERYGGDAGIEACEQLFWIDSEAVLGIVELLDGDAGADARWRLALRGADQLLDALGLPAEARARIFADARDALGREHGADAAFYAQLGDRAKREQAAIEALLARDPAVDADHELRPGFELLDAAAARARPVGEALRARGVAIEELAWSLVHMHCNRLLHASQRAQELVLYDLLRRWHQARRARAPKAAR